MKIFSKKAYEGYLCIDHTNSPGFDEATASAGHRSSLQPFLGRGQKLEAATNKCSHCERKVIKNPLRTRERGHCSQCDKFLCDPCMTVFYLTSECRCLAKRLNDYFDKLAKGAA